MANGQNFSWSPTANVLAVSGQDGLWLVPVEGEPHLEAQGARVFTGACWSPDGKYLAYSVTLPADDPKLPKAPHDALYESM